LQNSILERAPIPDREKSAREILSSLTDQDKLAVAVLDTMWDWRSMTSRAGYSTAPRFFRINARNHTGRRLYKLIGPSYHLLVTDSCKELVSSPKEHGNPDPIWLSDNLQIIHSYHPIDILLICGKVAQKTFLEILGMVEDPLFHEVRIIEIPHPAARTWTKERIKEVSRQIQEDLQS
jgi:hypothetical protein